MEENSISNQSNGPSLSMRSIAVGLAVYASIITGNLISNHIHYRFFRNTDQVQTGYVTPSELEIRLDDVNNDGEDEVVLIYKNQNFLFKDLDGTPAVVPYRSETRIIENGAIKNE